MLLTLRDCLLRRTDAADTCIHRICPSRAAKTNLPSIDSRPGAQRTCHQWRPSAVSNERRPVSAGQRKCECARVSPCVLRLFPQRCAASACVFIDSTAAKLLPVGSRTLHAHVTAGERIGCEPRVCLQEMTRWTSTTSTATLLLRGKTQNSKEDHNHLTQNRQKTLVTTVRVDHDFTVRRHRSARGPDAFGTTSTLKAQTSTASQTRFNSAAQL